MYLSIVNQIVKIQKRHTYIKNEIKHIILYQNAIYKSYHTLQLIVEPKAPSTFLKTSEPTNPLARGLG
jgi:hypothetical protein